MRFLLKELWSEGRWKGNTVQICICLISKSHIFPHLSAKDEDFFPACLWRIVFVFAAFSLHAIKWCEIFCIIAKVPTLTDGQTRWISGGGDEGRPRETDTSEQV